MFNKDMRISLLLDFYGEVLTDRQRDLTALYYNEDLSLSEIAEITGISRQGVRDAVKKAEAELLKLEEKLGLADRFDNLKKELSDISSSLEKLILTCKSPDELKLIIKRLNNLSI